MWNHMDYGWGWGMWLAMLVATIGFGLLVAYVVRAMFTTRRTHPATPPVDDPIQIVDGRLARGEIDYEEYVRIRRALTEHR